MGIERRLDLPHDAERSSCLGSKVARLALPDPVFSRARSFHAQGARGEAIEVGIYAVPLGSVRGVPSAAS